MNFRLLKASLISVFGRGSDYPARAAGIRLVLTLCICLSLAWTMTPTVQTFPLVAQLPDSIVFVFVAVCFQALTSVCLILAAGSIISNDGMSKLLSSLPLKEGELWGAIVMPKIILSTLLVMLTAQPLMALATKLHFSLAWLVIAVLAGLVSGLGISEYRPTQNFMLNSLLGLSLLTAQAMLCRQLFSELVSTQQVSDITVAQILILILFPLLWLIKTVRDFRNQITAGQRSSHINIPLPIPYKLWALTKIVRNKRMLGSLAFTFIIILSSAGYAMYKKTVIEDGGILLFAAAVLTSAYCTDLRGLARRFNPPEIIGLRGTSWFFASWLSLTFLSALILMVPVGLVMQMLAENNHLVLAVSWLGMGTFGAAVGLLVSTILVPNTRDVSSQFLGALLSTAMFFALPKISFAANLAPLAKGPGYLMMAVGLIITAYLIELHRNKFEWRLYATGK